MLRTFSLQHAEAGSSGDGSGEQVQGLSAFNLGYRAFVPVAGVAAVACVIAAWQASYGSRPIGLAGILVKTGKYREANTNESEVNPDAIIDSIADLPALLG